MIYVATKDFGKEMETYLFIPQTSDQKEFKVEQGKFLREIALMQVYACGAPRKVNDKLESLDSVLDCSAFF